MGHFVSQIIILLFQRFAITFITVLSQKIIKDNSVKLIHVSNVVNYIIQLFKENESKVSVMPHDKELTVSNTLARLNEFNKIYISNNTFPDFKSSFDINLFNTFRSYLNLEKHFPKPSSKKF